VDTSNRMQRVREAGEWQNHDSTWDDADRAYDQMRDEGAR
jgi:hypothetical protein